MRRALSILILVLLSPAVTALPVTLDVPVPNGNFALGPAFWRLSGAAEISGGAARLGHDGPDCFGSVTGGIAATLTSEHPVMVQREILFDLSVHTADVIAYDRLAVALVSSGGTRIELARINPNTHAFVCDTFHLPVSIAVPEDLVNEPLRLEFRVEEDTYGDTFHVRIDNVRMRP